MTSIQVLDKTKNKIEHKKLPKCNNSDYNSQMCHISLSHPANKAPDHKALNQNQGTPISKNISPKSLGENENLSTARNVRVNSIPEKETM